MQTTSRKAARALAVVLAFASCTSAPAPAPPAAPPPAPPPDPRSVAPAPLASGRLPDTARPLRYRLAFELDPAREDYEGRVEIEVHLPRPTSAVVLHGRSLTITRAEVDQRGERQVAASALRMAAGTRGEPEELVLSVARPLRAGDARLVLEYRARYHDRLSGFYRVEEEGRTYVYSDFEPMDARRAFPCFDDPSFKVPFDVTIHTPRGNLAVSNAPEIFRATDHAVGSVTYQFASTRPLPTYLVALGVGPFDVEERRKASVPLRVIAPRGKARLGGLALEAAATQLDLLARYFEQPYPFEKLDLVAVPNFSAGAMENPGLVTFRDSLLLLDPKTASAASRRAMILVMAHELAHQWFGNLVTLSWWDDLWLNEAFANWMESKVADAYRPDLRSGLEDVVSKAAVMELDSLASARAVRQPVATHSDALGAFDGITYAKGASVIGMLERWAGEDRFRDGVRTYLQRHAFRNATASDLFTALSAATGKDVGAVAGAFVDQPGVPLVRVETVCQVGAVPRLRLSQERYAPRPGPRAGEPPRWKIPVCLRHEKHGGTDRVCTLLAEASGEIALESNQCPRWVYPNDGESGYYRFAMPREQFRALAASLWALDARSRIGLLANAWALLRSGDLDATQLLGLLEAYGKERDRVVLEQVIFVLARVGDTLVDEGTRPAFRRYVSSILLPIAKELGWEPAPRELEERRLLRHTVLGALAVHADDPWLHAGADALAIRYLADPGAADADVAAVALRVSTRRATASRFDQLMAAVERARTPQDRNIALGALGSFADAAVQRRALDLLLTDRLRVQDARALLGAVASWPESRPVALAWMKERFDEIKKRFPARTMSRMAGLAGTLCSRPERDDADAFFRARFADVEGVDRDLAQAIERADLCIDLRAREGERASRYLKRAR